MKDLFSMSSAAAGVAVAFAISSCSTQEEMASKPAAAPAAAPAKAEAKAESKAKAETTTAKAESKDGEAKGDAKGEGKAKAEKARGDIGLLDTEKNYLILVTKEGKLITLDYDAKTKATQIDPTPSKMADVGLGSSATVEYTKQGDKNIAKSVEFTPAKGGD